MPGNRANLNILLQHAAYEAFILTYEAFILT